MGANMSAQSKQMLIAGAVATAVAAGVYFYSQKTNNVNKKGEQAKVESGATQTADASVKASDVTPKVSKEDLLAIFEAIIQQMSQIVIQLAKIEQKVRQESATAGKEIPEESLGAYLMNQFEEAMKAIESQVYKKYKTNEEEVQVATEYYSDDKEVQAVVSKLKQLFRVITGQQEQMEPTMAVPDDLTVEKMIEIMEETMEAMNVAMEETCEEIKEEDYPAGQEFQVAINQAYVKKADEVTQKIHDKHGISRELLQSAMLKYQSDAAFITKMQELQAVQAERFSKAAEKLGDKFKAAM